jgi:hypothetical protein
VQRLRQADPSWLRSGQTTTLFSSDTEKDPVREARGGMASCIYPRTGRAGGRTAAAGNAGPCGALLTAAGGLDAKLELFVAESGDWRGSTKQLSSFGDVGCLRRIMRRRGTVGERSGGELAPGLLHHHRGDDAALEVRLALKQNLEGRQILHGRPSYEHAALIACALPAIQPISHDRTSPQLELHELSCG